MNWYVLDTDIVTLYRKGHPVVCGRVDVTPPKELAITVITVEEQLTGWYTRLRRTQTRDELAETYRQLTEDVTFLSGRRILTFSKPAILRYEQLLALKLNVGKMDLRIGAIAFENGGTVVTRNLRDFQRIPNLTIENWAV